MFLLTQFMKKSKKTKISMISTSQIFLDNLCFLELKLDTAYIFISKKEF